MKFDAILKADQVVCLKCRKHFFAIINSFATAAQLPSQQACKVDFKSGVISIDLKRKDASLSNFWTDVPILQDMLYSASKLVRIAPIYHS